jgi:hypothetical protein
MTDQQIVAKLEKTLASINAFIGRGGSLGRNGNLNYRGHDLLRRYNDLRALLCGDRGYTPAWTAYCASINACRTHDGYDLFC